MLSSPWVLAGRYFLLSIRGTRGLVARLDATFRGIRGIGEGVVVQRAGVLCSLCRFCAVSVQPTNRMITPFVDPSAQSTHYLL